MENFLASFVNTVLLVVYWVMHVIGYLDSGFSRLMASLGVPDAHEQLYYFVALIAIFIFLALAVVRGYLGWIIMMLLLLLLLDRLVPTLGAHSYNVPGPLPGALNAQ